MREESDAGSGPVRALWERSRTRRVVALKRVVGIAWERLLWGRERRFRWAKKPSSEGR